jgi:hypothetical protein
MVGRFSVDIYKRESSLIGDFGARIMPLLCGESVPKHFIEISFKENAGWYEILNSRNVRMMWQAVEK